MVDLGILFYAFAKSLYLGIVLSDVISKKIVEVVHLSKKKKKIIAMSITLIPTFFYFIKYFVQVIGYFKNPLGFSFMGLFILISLAFLILGHFAFYVLIMEDKEKVKKVEDIEEWWTRWDRTT